jgi:hypothetical protein
MAVTAEQLNIVWDEVTSKLDAYYNSLPVDVRNAINKAISDWQNFYFGQSGIWPEAEVERWRGILAKTQETLAAAIKPGAKTEPLPVAAKQAPKTVADATFYVQGQVEPAKIPEVVFPQFADMITLQTPRWLFPALIGVPALFILYKVSKSKKGRS